MAQRNSNLELLRLISMLLIVLFHLNRISFYESFASIGLLNQIAFQTITSWGILGVDCFVIITAFFMKDFNEIKFSKIMKIVIQTFIYIFVFELMRLVVMRPGLEAWGTSLLNGLLHDPLFTRNYWFCWAYVALMLLIPYLNKIPVDSFLFKVALAMMLVGNFRMEYNFLADVFNFVLIYLVSRWIFAQEHSWLRTKKVGILLSVIILICVVNALTSVVGQNNMLINLVNGIVSKGRYSLLMYIGAMCLFYVFLDMRPKTNKLINTMARYSLGIYLFHECAAFHMTAYIPFVIKDYFGIWGTLLISTMIIFVAGIFMNSLYDFVIKRVI